MRKDQIVICIISILLTLVGMELTWNLNVPRFFVTAIFLMSIVGYISVMILGWARIKKKE
ncbi:MAG: hypothetical protein HFG97_02125 [Dorea sp.]|jgi:hypothetical protein|nr:hypothetical protein [Dorea sp.]